MNEINNHRKVLLTVREACEALSIGRTKLNELLRSNRLKGVKIGERGIRVPSSEIERFVAEGIGEGANS